MTSSGILMAVDPGGSTGVAVKLGDSAYATMTLDTMHSAKDLWDSIKATNPDKLAFEAFVTNNRVDTNMILTIELVGSIRGCCHALGIKAYRQVPQMRKSFIPDARKLLTKRAGHTPHEIDALAHLLCLEWRMSRGEIR